MSNHWNHNTHYHRLVLAAVPSPCLSAIDIGCGEGELTYKLSAKCGHVTGIDLDQDTLPVMYKPSNSNVSYIAGDVMMYPFPANGFDFIASVATLHHLPLDAALLRFKNMLAPGGVLVIIGLYKTETVLDYLSAAIAFPVGRILRLFRNYDAGDAAMTTPTQTLADIRGAAKAVLPGAVIKRRLLFRYSLFWQK